jgi:hypothetical protein
MMNLRIPLQVVDSHCVSGILDAEEHQSAGQRVPPPATSLTSVVGQKLSVLPLWAALPTADGGRALKVMKAALKLSHVLWQMEVPEDTLEAERRQKMKASSVVELDLPKKPVTEAERQEAARVRHQKMGWTMLPGHARPFPWDGQELQPVSEQVGLTVRPIATFVDKEEDQPIEGLPTSIGPAFQVAFSSKMATTLKKIRRDGRIGFHATSAENSDRYAIFVGFHSPDEGNSSSSGGDASESGSADDASDAASSSKTGGSKKKSPRGKLHFAAQLIPDSDAEPLQTVKEGTLGAAAGLLPVVALSASDEVRITLHLQTQGSATTMTPVSGSGEGTGGEEGGATSTFQTAAPFDLCVRSRLDRDLISAAILALQGDSTDFTESMERRLQLELQQQQEEESEEEPRLPFRRQDYVVCRVQDALR